MKSYLKKLNWVVLLCTLSTQSCAKSDSTENAASSSIKQMQQEQIRPAAVAGSWYANDPEILENQIRAFLGKAESVTIEGRIDGLVVPHAGYSFSGFTAAHAYKQVAHQDYETIIILAPNHGYEGGFEGVSVYSGDGYDTPLGVARVDKDLASAIVDACNDARFSSMGHIGEHSLEIQLPFIKVLFPDAKIVPIVMGDRQWDTCLALGNAIAKAIGNKRALIIASSDLYHAPSQTGNWYDECVATNTATLNAIEKLDAQAFWEGMAKGRFQACGGGPITALLVAAKELGSDNAKIVHRTNSGDVSGTKSGYIVGYGAAVIFDGSDTSQEQGAVSDSENDNYSAKIEFAPLDISVQKNFLHMAREAIEYYLETGKKKEFTPTEDVMNEKRGVFVTINKKDQLRGCIGYHNNDIALYELVPDRALAAAFGDPRFQPLDKSELDDITIKISVYLTNVYQIDDISEFEMGVHGIIMFKNGRGATYLPEVPIEAGWTTIEEEMESLCHKAGLPSDAWRQGADFYVYKTQVFDEKLFE